MGRKWTDDIIIAGDLQPASRQGHEQQNGCGKEDDRIFYGG